MSNLLTVREIAERVLRKVGTYSIRDTGADAGELEEVRYWLDLIVGHVAANQRTWWLVKETLEFELDANISEYDLNSVLGLTNTDEKIQFVVLANLKEVASGQETPLHVASRSKYEDIANKTQTGRPEMLYVDRQQAPIAKVWPLAALDGVYTIKLVVQRFGPDLTKKKNRNAEFVPDIRSSWNLWLITRGAVECGDGPIVKLPIAETREWKTDAAALLQQLYAYDNDEQNSEPRQTAYTDF